MSQFLFGRLLESNHGLIPTIDAKHIGILVVVLLFFLGWIRTALALVLILFLGWIRTVLVLVLLFFLGRIRTVLFLLFLFLFYGPPERTQLLCKMLLSK